MNDVSAVLRTEICLHERVNYRAVICRHCHGYNQWPLTNERSRGDIREHWIINLCRCNLHYLQNMSIPLKRFSQSLRAKLIKEIYLLEILLK